MGVTHTSTRRGAKMRTMAKSAIKACFRTLGLEISRLEEDDEDSDKKFDPEPEDRFKWLQAMDIRTVLDIGAHKGESAIFYHQLFPDATVYSFEPLGDCFEALCERVENLPGQYNFNIAIGDRQGEMAMQRNEYSPSSSLLKVGEAHKKAFPFTAREFEETIRVDTLDSVAGGLDLQREILVKIDVQGFERNVIDGGTTALPQARVIIVELSFDELYEGQPRFDEIYSRITDMGFEYAGSWDQLLDPNDGRVLQQDGIFVRR